MQRKLGRSGIKVSAMGMGCWAIGGPWSSMGDPSGWGEADDDESIKALHAAYDHGITFYDTAANYGAGHSEVILGQAFKDRRDKVIIATKFGYKVDEQARAVTGYGEDGNAETGDVVTPLRDDVEASLRRLGTDYIDLYQFHVNEYEVEKAAGVRDALEEFVKAGKIRYYGWSTDYPQRLRVFVEGEHCVAVQANMNVIHRNPEILAMCDEFDQACINRGPLAMGLLTGKYTKESTWQPNDVRTAQWFKDYFLGPVLDNLPKIRDVLTSEGRTLAQGALGWLWGHHERTIPIPGIRTVRQAEENAKAMEFGPLTPDQMAQIESLLDLPPE